MNPDVCPGDGTMSWCVCFRTGWVRVQVLEFEVGESSLGYVKIHSGTFGELTARVGTPTF